MKKSLVKILMMLIVALMVLPSSSFAEAGHLSHDHDNHDHHDHEDAHEDVSMELKKDDEYSIMYVPCPGGGKHYMTSHGTGKVRDSSGKTIIDGYAHQCSKCYEVIISERQPRVGWTSLGKYAVKTVGHRLTTAYIMTNPSKIGTNTSLKVAPWTSYTWP